MFSVRPSDAVLGAEITGIDLSQPVSDDDFARIVNVLHEREVIVFKRQDITAEQHIAFSRRFGDLERHVRTDKCRPGYTTKIVGMSDEESEALLSELFAHAVRPEFIYTHKWEVGDLLFWDNCATQHRAVVDYALPLRRRMERTTIDGTVPF